MNKNSDRIFLRNLFCNKHKNTHTPEYYLYKFQNILHVFCYFPKSLRFHYFHPYALCKPLLTNWYYGQRSSLSLNYMCHLRNYIVTLSEAYPSIWGNKGKILKSISVFIFQYTNTKGILVIFKTEGHSPKVWVCLVFLQHFLCDNSISKITTLTYTFTDFPPMILPLAAWIA